LPETAAVLRQARWVMAMSRFGESQLRHAGFDKVMYVPHGIETEVFKPIDRAKARAEMAEFIHHDLQDQFLIVTVAANKGTPSRKNFDGMLAAFSQFSQDHPNALFYIHAENQGIWSGEDLRALVQAYGVEDKVFFPPQYPLLTGMISPKLLNIVYNAADVLMLLSRGEGFGLPIVEAQASGCPVIVTDFSAMPELVFAGVTVPAIPFMASTGYWQRLALIPAALEALAWAYQHRGDVGIRAQGRKGALAYDIERIMRDYFLPAVRTMERDLKLESLPTSA
jgi:glycosyltransferase involved in cell wall biosynthesis